MQTLEYHTHIPTVKAYYSWFGQVPLIPVKGSLNTAAYFMAPRNLQESGVGELDWPAQSHAWALLNTFGMKHRLQARPLHQHRCQTSVMLLCLNGRKSPRPCCKTWWRASPEEWRLLQQKGRTNSNFNIHGFEHKAHTGLVFRCSHTFGFVV